MPDQPDYSALSVEKLVELLKTKKISESTNKALPAELREESELAADTIWSQRVAEYGYGDIDIKLENLANALDKLIGGNERDSGDNSALGQYKVTMSTLIKFHKALAKQMTGVDKKSEGTYVQQLEDVLPILDALCNKLGIPVREHRLR